MKPDFLIIGLPRSRTAWLANWLTYGKSFCFHEPLLGCDSIDAFHEKMNAPHEVVGVTDTGAVFWLPKIMRDDLRLVIVERPVEDCIQSLERAGIPFNADLVYRANDLLLAAKRKHGCMWVPFEALDRDFVGASLWHYCVGDGFDVTRFRMLRDLRVEVKQPAFIEKVKANLAAYENLMESSHG